MNRPSIFISYSHRDEGWKERLVKHLGVLSREAMSEVWDGRLIAAGDDWEAEIARAIDAASLSVLLISPDFLTSDFINNYEVPRLLRRRAEHGVRIVPVVVRPCAWRAAAWLRALQVRPYGGHALSLLDEGAADAALADIVLEIQSLLEFAAPPGGREHVRLGPDDISLSRMPVTGPHMFGRAQEMEALDRAWGERRHNVVTLVAWGGVGKSALINHWLLRLSLDNYAGAERVYAWSFYSQGTSERAASADEFIDWLLGKYSDPAPSSGSSWAKGQRLARLIQNTRTLLVLDGLEPLQFPPGVQEGRLKDAGLQALIGELATHNPGLCVITTRMPVANLGQFEGRAVLRFDLEHLSTESGAQLLASLGVKGQADELEQAAAEFGGHSLALTLLGSYLADAYGGDVRRRDVVGWLETEERHGRHARRVMASYEKWLGEGPELDVLRLLGLFDRPAAPSAVAALLAAPHVAGLTDHLLGLSEPDWQRTLQKLRRARLLAPPNPGDEPGTLDTHPLVREHFGQQLEQGLPAAWREGNARLYEHLKRTAKEFPETLEEMAPLFAAVTHGCRAGRHRDALDEVYKRRIQWGDKHYTSHTLGALGAELAALSNFFAEPWRRVVDGLDAESRAFLFNEAGFDLRTQGRLAEAAQAIGAGIELRVAEGDWVNAAVNAGNLSEIHLALGELVSAEDYARRSVDFADRSGDAFRRLDMRAGLADVLHHAGRLEEAAALFREAEELQKADQPQYPLLYSNSGFRYCDLLLTLGEYEEVERRAALTLEWLKPRNFVFAISMDHLSLGRAHLLRASREGGANFGRALDHLNQAVEGLQAAGRQDCLPLGLLARAELNRIAGDYDWARADLEEAMTIAERADLRLSQVDCHLAFAHLRSSAGEEAQARESLRLALEGVDKFGYQRRRAECRELAQRLGTPAG